MRNFVEPLLTNPKFMNNTLVVITFDENHTYTDPNRVFSILLGDAVPAALVGTTDDSFYDHYSEMATVEANWGLHTLGRWDVGANVYAFVGNKTGDTITHWPELTGTSPTVFLNDSYAGPYNTDNSSVPFPVPNTKAVKNGRTVLPAIVDTWGKLTGSTIYNTGVEIPDAMHPPAGFSAGL